MSHWTNPEYNLGIIKAGSPKKIIFKGKTTMPTILQVIPYCGCTTTNFNKETKELVITYSNARIPDQVKGAQSITKRIEIKYEDNTSEILIIKAVKTR